MGLLDLRLRRSMSVVSRTLELASFAVLSTGNVVVNVAVFDGVASLEEALKLALVQRGPVFIGLHLEDRELAGPLDRVKHMAAEAAAHIIGRRQRRARRRRRS